jgi:signal transduction histidine kinase
MRLRARLAVVALALILVPIFVMSLISLDSRIDTMIEDMSHSTDFMIEQIFEQVRLALEQGNGNVAAKLKGSEPVRKVLDSTVAFGSGVVSAALVGNDGQIIVAAHGEGEGKPAPNLPSVAVLESNASHWMLFASIPSLLTSNVYESRRRVEINNQPVVTISIGVTTALIADKARHLLMVIVTTAGLVIAGTLLVVTLISNRILEQLAVLTRGYEQLAAGARPGEIKVSGDDELGTLAEKFNELSRKVRADRSRLDNDQSHLFDAVRLIQDGIVLLDSNGVVLFANENAQTLLAPKKEKEALDGASFATVLSSNHPMLALVESAVEGSEAHDVPLVLPDGVKILVSLFRLGRERIPAGLLIVLRDLQPVIELETALDASNRLARLGTLISGLAHQLRSPLHGMNMRLELLSREAGDVGGRHVERLRHEVTRLDEAVEALLRFMRPEELKVTEFDVNELLKELGSRAMSDRTRVEYDLDPSIPPIRADRGMIYEALTNVVTNADQAMRDGGTLKLSSKTDGSTIEVSIVDQGHGIAKEQLDRIFDLYYTTKANGSGLGLPFAMRAIELNGGKISIDSQLGQGTVCTVAFPIAANPSAKTSVSSAA